MNWDDMPPGDRGLIIAAFLAVIVAMATMLWAAFLAPPRPHPHNSQAIETNPPAGMSDFTSEGGLQRPDD